MFQPATRSDWRYERKFALADLSRPEIESVVRRNPATFCDVYHRRWINNIYFDTPLMAAYHENLSGHAGPRIKYRVRWYGSLSEEVAEPTLELKIRQGQVNRKRSFRLAPFTLDAALTAADLRDLFRSGDLPEPLLHDLLKLRPTLINRYSRNYFQTTDRQYRITIDSDLSYYPAHPRPGALLASVADRRTHVVELKYAPDGDSRARQITQHFPFRLSRSSKYVQGIEQIARR